MSNPRNQANGTKVKISTILDKSVVDRLKERAAREGKTISALIEDAVLKSENEESLGKEMRLKARDQLFSIRFNVSDDDWRTIMGEEYYGQ